MCSADGASSVCKAQARLPSVELCDGIDNDCDGLVDETYASRATSCGVGECVSTGATSCVDGQEVDSCVPKTPPSVDDAVCDGRDEDCDGSADEDYPTAPTACGVGACAAQGTLSCQNGRVVDSCRPGSAAALDATCDGVDDDCDGVVDDDYMPASATCGVGACASDGLLRCEAGSLVDTCAALPAGPHDASCDGLDDDCDGQLDEDVVALQEVCNGDDDDCDGLVDEGLSCSGGGPSGECVPSGTEICNGLDDVEGVCLTPDQDGDGISLCQNDCDDNDATIRPAGTDGQGGLIAAGSEGTACDQRDNDCNGKVDDLGTCTVPDAFGVCAQGFLSCGGAGSEPQCVTVTWPGQFAEVCGDGLDNDCDPGTSDDAGLQQCTEPGVAGETCGLAIATPSGGSLSAGAKAGEARAGACHSRAMSETSYPPELYALLHRGVAGDRGFYVRACRGAARVLELGCGYGRLIPALAGTGARYQGLELDPGLLRMARRVRRSLEPSLRARVSLRHGDMRNFQFRARFDRILLPHSTLYCLQTERDVRRCLRCAREHLTEDGELILDAYAGDRFHDSLSPATMTGEQREFLTRVTGARASYLVFERTRWIRSQKRFVVTYEYESERGELSKGTIHHRYLLRTDLERLLTSTGFRITRLARDFEGGRYSKRSEHLVLRAARTR